MRIQHIDHVVMTVASIENTCKFYKDYLNFEIVTFKNNRKALKCGLQKINLHERGKEFSPKAENVCVGSLDICLIIEDPVAEILKNLEEKGIEIIEGPVQRTGTHNNLLSIYIFDPDGNLIELSNVI